MPDFQQLAKNKILLWSLILTITILWGYAWVVMKASLEFMGPFTFSAFRFGTGTLTLFLILFLVRMGPPPKKYWKHLAVIGFLQTAVVFLAVMFALKFVEAGKSSVLLYSMPMWSSLLAAKFLGEKLNKFKIIGLAIGMVGLLTILGWDIWMKQNLQVIFGELLIVFAAVAWGVSNIYYRIHVTNLPQLQVSAWQMLFGTIAIILATVIMEWGEPVAFTPVSIFYVLFTGVFASAICFTVWFIIISYIDMVTATISTLLVPIFGLLLGYLILDEALTASILIGSGLVIIGIIIAQKKMPVRDKIAE